MPESSKRDVPLHLTTPPSKKDVARLGEEAAAAFYANLGYTLLERNWTSGRFGEIDLILLSNEGVVIFAEVKTRRETLTASGFVDSGFDAINWQKRRKILITARSYLARARKSDCGYQCDAVLVTYSAIKRTGNKLNMDVRQIVHVPGAFDSV